MGIPVSWPLTLHTDSSQALSFQRDTCPTSKIRGCFQLREAWVRELRDQGVVRTEKIPRELNMADMLTHCLSRCKFRDALCKAQNLQRYNCKGACVYKPIFMYSYNCLR